MSSDRTTLEAVAAIIESISGVAAGDLDAGTDLLDLGLDSLMFVRIGRVLEGRYQVSISMKHFYDELTNLGALAAFLAANAAPAAAQAAADTAAAAEPLTAVPPSDPVPMTAASAPVAVPSAPLAAASAPVAAPLTAVAPLSGAADLHAVMAAHMALMRRYLDGLAAAPSASAGRSAAPGSQPDAAATAAARPQQQPSLAAPAPAAAAQDPADAIETRRKFSGIVTSREELSAAQREFIAALAARLSARCPRSKQLAQDGKTWLADWKYSLQFKQDLKELRFPIVCATADGAHFTDVDGNDYVDIAMGMGVHYFGHSPRFVDAAVRAQLDRNLALGPQAQLAPEVARRICALTGHDRAAFFVTGSDAVMLALRLVRAARGRDKVVMFAGAYHGICSDVLAAQGERGAVPMSPGLPSRIVDDLVVLDYDAPESLDQIRAMADQLAGVLVEPVQSRNPALQPQRFLRQLRALCTEFDIPLIFDEMVNGFRQAAGGMQEWFGVRCDLSTYGKIIGGGYPLSVIAGKAELMQWIDGGLWQFGDDSAPLADSIATGGTHNKHPVALAAAAAVLEHIEQHPQLYVAARMQMYRLADRCNVWFEGNAVPLRLTSFGTQFKFESYAPALELELFFYLLLEQGIYTWELHVANLSTAHSEADCDRLFAAIVHAVQQLREGGFSFRAERLRRQYLPMSSVQKRLYAITQREGAEKPYHLAGAWRLQGTVDAARLEDCVHQVIIRHEALRTAFVVVDGQFYQRIVPQPRFFLDRLDAGGHSAEALLDAYIQPFNLLEPPLLRVALAAQADGSSLLLLDVHHIAADGLSMNVLLQEILALYDGELLPPVRSQARHVQDAIAQYLGSDAARSDAQYWRTTLQPLLATRDSFDLSPDFSRPAVTDFAGQRLALKLDATATAALHRYCRAQRSSTFAVLFAVFVAWTWRYARQPQFMVGLPASGRPDAMADNAVGMFVNTLVFPANVEAHSSVDSFLQQVRNRLFEVQEHADYPFSELLGELGVVPSANRNPLFDVMFSYENAGSRSIRTRSFSGETLAQYEGAGMFDISFDLIEAEQGILVNCAYAQSLYSEATMRRRLDAYLTLLQALLTTDGSSSVAEWVQGAGVAHKHSAALPLSTQSSSAASQTAVPPGTSSRVTVPATGPATLAQLWRLQVQRSAQQPALIEESRHLSYAELDRLVQKTAFTLFNLYGVRAGDRVLVSLDSSIDLVLAMLALFSMGAVYVPVTPDTPLARVRAIQRQCGARYLIHGADNAFSGALAQEPGFECMAMHSIADSAIATTRHQSLQPPAPTDLAYVIFTSGSTGLPKGVEIHHAGIANSVQWRIGAYALDQRDTTLQMPSAAFDASVIDILSALLSGGRLVLLDSSGKRSVERIAQQIEQHQVSLILLTPTLYRVLLERIPSTLARLRCLTLAGEKLPQDLVTAHFAQLPAVELWNEYGPTECSVVVCAGRMQPQQQRVSIGWPVSNTQVHILDDSAEPVPDGVWGRLWVSGIGLARGYAGDEATTQQKFRCLPALDGLRCYDTGDIARVLADGALEFKGRDDGQVKVNGYRIELEEVETQLRSQLQLSEVAAAVVDKGGSAALQAWVVAESVPAGWREALQAVLPQWMLPTTLHAVAALPLLPSGKLDRKALLPPETAVVAEPAAQPAVVPPAGSALALLLQYCREILARPALQAGDHYFNAGGDSIQAIVLASRLAEAGYVLDVNDLFRHPVLSDLAGRIVTKSSRTLPALQDSAAVLPTPMQLWCFATCRGEPDAFTQAAWLQLPAGITLAQLDALCRHWVSQHAVFGETVQLMAARRGQSGAQPDLAALLHCSEHSAACDVDALAVAARAQISLQHGPLLNVALLREGSAARALVVFHHFVVDAVSWQLLQTQWAQLWQDQVEGRAMRALPEGATMSQFASALHSPAAQQRAMLELPFWQAQLAQCRPVFTAAAPQPVDTPRARLQRHAMLEPALAECLLATGHARFRTRGGDLLLAVFADALARVCALDAVTLLVESNGRSQRYADADFSSTLGWMTSAYPLCIDGTGAASGQDWDWKIERLRELLQRVPEQGVGYGILRHLLQHAGLPSQQPQLVFNYLGRFQQQTQQPFAILDELPAGDRMGELGLLPPVEFVCHADAAGLHIAVSASAELVDAAWIERLLQSFREQAQDLASACSSAAAPALPSPVDFVASDWSLDDYLKLLATHGLARASVDDLVPLTAMQQSLLFHARSKPDDLAYLEQVDFTLQGVTAERLGAAFRQLLQLYPLLRAAFLAGPGGRSAQLVMHAVELPLHCEDLSALTPQEQQRHIDAAVQADRATPFDITRAPLMRVQLFTLQQPRTAQRGKPAVHGKVHVIWTHHHLLMDGWCVGILYEQLLASCVQPTLVAAVDTAAQRCNADYFRWLAARDVDSARAYWSTLLAGVEQPTRLLPWPREPGAEPLAADAPYQLQREELQVPAALTAQLQTWAASHSATLSTALRLAWGLLLARFSNSDDVVFGTVVSGRPPEVAGIESAVGLFINTVPLRFRLDAKLNAVTALQQLQQQANASRAHEYLDLAQIQAAAPDLRAREPLFDHLVVLENYPMDATLRGEGTATDSSGKDGCNADSNSDTTSNGNNTDISINNIRAYERTDLPLNLVLVPQDGALLASFLSDARVYPAGQIRHLAEHFLQLLQQLVAQPRQPLVALQLLTADESRWLQQWNQREAAWPADTTLFDLFRATALQHAERVALRDEAGSMSYAELLQRVEAVAGGLLAHGAFAPGQRVTLWLPRNREMIVGMLAVLAAGGCYVALDPVYPAERIGFIVQDSAAALLLQDGAMPPLSVSCATVTLDALARQAHALLQLPKVAQDAAAYVIYTSGSTGQPKGCAISQRNVLRLLRNDRFDFDFDHNDVWVLAHSFCFDFSVWEMYGALLNGGTLLVPAAEQVRNTETFAALVAEHGVSVLNQTPAAFQQFIKAALKLPAERFAALRLVVFGGDSLACNRLAPWIERFPTSRVKLVNMYGITETTVHVTYHEVTAAQVHAATQLNLVGRPLPETQVWIVDRWGRLQPPGIVGEIVVAGSGVGLGYLNRPELNAQKFAPLPAAGIGRCYWSGDLGYISPTLGLVYLGRNDHQVQVRGFRVECDEIARCFETHQSVEAAVVLPVENAHGTELVVYLVGDATAAPAQWRPWLTRRLPDYMVPSRTLWLDALPLTRNGKIDRKALPDPFTLVPAAAATAGSEVEAAIIAAWQRVLQHEQIDALSNFFDVGGHSLKALSLADLLQADYGLTLSVADIFECPTPRQQAERCSVAAQPLPDTELDALIDAVGLDELDALLADLPGQQKGA